MKIIILILIMTSILPLINYYTNKIKENIKWI